jgi:hypothetical protein
MIKGYKKLKTGKIEIRYFIIHNEEDKTTVKMESPQPPREAFDEVLLDLKPHFIKICELPETDKSKIRLTGINITRSGENQVIGVVFQGERDLVGSGHLTLTTPKKHIEKPKSDTEDCHILNPQCGKLVLKFIDECQAYVNGERLQIEIETEQEEEGGTNE